ncbi:penicillin-binding protein 2 [bacterium SCSIO 12696]|nr:penicillin-binding protein 2 [bacterium SCSIO 12696]
MRLLVAALVVVGLTLALAGRYYSLQVTNHDHFVAASDENRVHVRPVAPIRGLVYDRNGVLLADNRPSFTLRIVVERSDDLDALLAQLGQMIDISEQQVAQFKKRLTRRHPYEAIPLRYNLTERERGILAVDAHRLPGVEVAAQVVRYYPQQELMAHVLGYVSRISEGDLNRRDEQLYQGTDVIGKRGLEYYYEDQLLGQVGNEHVETNSLGRVMRVLERNDPVPGSDLQLFIDSRLQKVALDALAGERGSVVALDTETGGVLAMVSAPSYNANLFVTGISHRDYGELRDSLDRPLLNRTVQGTYPPASTVKPAYGLATLETGVATPATRIWGPGFYKLPNHDHEYRCWERRGHGHMTLNDAIRQSCDIYFYRVSYDMGIDRMAPYGKMFGLGQPTGIDLSGEKAGVMPDRPWKEGARGLPWFPGDTINTSIGQGFSTATPLQLAVMAMRLANRGEGRPPKLVKKVAEEVVDLEPPSQHVQASDASWNVVQAAMESVIHNIRGTAQSISKDLQYRIAGKTGTAQVVGIAQGEEYDAEAVAKRKRPHALFIGYAPADDPQIAVAVIIENGEKSSRSAKVARQVMDAWLLEYAPTPLTKEGAE